MFISVNSSVPGDDKVFFFSFCSQDAALSGVDAGGPVGGTDCTDLS